MNSKHHILIVEDEAAIRTGLEDVLVFHGYDVTSAEDGLKGLDLARSNRFDLVLLDIMLPGMNGFDVCNAIREQDREQPIIMLTARVADEDIVTGLRLGADDYVAKPFSVEQLVLRISAVLRRTKPETAAAIELTSPAGDTIRIDTLNLSATVTPGGSASADPVNFTRREMEILVYLHANRSRPVPREELLSEVWGYARDSDIETRTVDIHIAKLRRKLEPDPKHPTYLTTIRGAGYRMVSTDPE